MEEVTLVPRPVNQPVECWQPIVSANPRGLDFMAKHGMKGIVGGGSALMAERPIIAFQEANARVGRDLALGQNLCLGLNFHIAETREKAIREATPFFEEHLKLFAPLGMVPMRPEQLARVGERGAWAEDEYPQPRTRRRNRLLVLRPARRLRSHTCKTSRTASPGLEDVNVQSSMGTPLAVMMEQLEAFATDVMPGFRKI